MSCKYDGVYGYNDENDNDLLTKLVSNVLDISANSI